MVTACTTRKSTTSCDALTKQHTFSAGIRRAEAVRGYFGRMTSSVRKSFGVRTT